MLSFEDDKSKPRTDHPVCYCMDCESKMEWMGLDEMGKLVGSRWVTVKVADVYWCRTCATSRTAFLREFER